MIEASSRDLWCDSLKRDTSKNIAARLESYCLTAGISVLDVGLLQIARDEQYIQGTRDIFLTPSQRS